MAQRFRHRKRREKPKPAGDGQLVTGRVERLASDGSGVLRRPDGKVTFVPFALPQEDISCVVISEKKSFARARLEAIHVPSAARQEAVCSMVTRCGGCQIQHLSTPEQGPAKLQWFFETCERVGKWPRQTLEDVRSRAQLHSLTTLGYRQRARFHVTRSKQNVPERADAPVLQDNSSHTTLGFRAEESAPDVIDVTRGCPVLVPEIQASLGPLRQAAHDVLPCGARLQAEVTRYWPVGCREPRLALSLFQDDRSRSEPDKALLEQFLAQLTPFGFCNPADDILRIISPTLGTHVGPTGNPMASLSGQPGLSAHGVQAQPAQTYCVHRLGFIQPHEGAAPLYRQLASEVVRTVAQECAQKQKNVGGGGAAALPPVVRIWDLYGGCGLLSADAQVAAELEGCRTNTIIVEQSLPSLEAARAWRSTEGNILGHRLEIRQQDTLSFLLGRKYQFDTDLSDTEDCLETPDLIIADPPRSGLGAETCQALLQRMSVLGSGETEGQSLSARTPRLLLVFCDPAACARDTAVFLAAGFQVSAVHVVDAFPQTQHYEVLVDLRWRLLEQGLP